MSEICVFAGTTEGRQLVSHLQKCGVSTLACTATEYGGELLQAGGSVRVISRRLDEADMEALFARESFSRVVDATHPYAGVVTENIRKAAETAGLPYLRLLRSAGSAEDALFADSTEEAVELLKSIPGNILLTTGSKEIAKFAALPDFADRVYARVLSVEDSVAACRQAGLSAAHIIAMQGPFSKRMNRAMLEDLNCTVLVTKDGGVKGGFPEKVQAAREAGAKLLVIGRPVREDGLSIRETAKQLGYPIRPKVSIVGIGSGNPKDLTVAARDAIRHADCLIGAKRMLEAVSEPGQRRVEAIAPEKIAAAIEENTDCLTFAVVMAGDIGFYSGTKKLLPLLENCEVDKYPGLSSLVLLCARLGVSYEDVTCVSLHGRQGDICDAVRRHGKVFALVGGEDGMGKLCAALNDSGLGDTELAVGERLGYADEKITRGTARELCECTFDSLSVCLILGKPSFVVTPGMEDSAFLRGVHADGKAVPMTKREVRTAALSHLALTADAVCWDIGAGTGSVSIEMARLCPKGTVCALEKKADAITLLEQNKAFFKAENLTVISGSAPDGLDALPAPTHVFIGGSSGQMEEILRIALAKNPAVRIVATAIALETVAELTRCQKCLPWAQTDCVSLTVSNSRKAGDYHLMTAQNPVYIFTFKG